MHNAVVQHADNGATVTAQATKALFDFAPTGDVASDMSFDLCNVTVRAYVDWAVAFAACDNRTHDST